MLKKPTKVPMKAKIRQRAQEIYLARGRQPGRELDDWLQAEFELTPFPVVDYDQLIAAKSSRAKFALAKALQAAALISAGGVLVWHG